ncbi:MAG: hypothetical protein ACK4IY_00120 [Chitinophagales bacterium]
MRRHFFYVINNTYGVVNLSGMEQLGLQLNSCIFATPDSDGRDTT